MKFNIYFSIAFFAVLAITIPAAAQPQPGWQADLAFYFHDVSGTVTVVDEDTLQVDDFNYDGGGLSVYFYLATADDHFAFVDGLQIGPQLVHTVFEDAQLTIDLPAGETTDQWNAISVWCVTASANAVA